MCVFVFVFMGMIVRMLMRVFMRVCFVAMRMFVIMVMRVFMGVQMFVLVLSFHLDSPFLKKIMVLQLCLIAGFPVFNLMGCLFRLKKHKRLIS